MTDILLDAILDTIKTLPFLFGVYLLIEYLEHHSKGDLGSKLQKLGPFGAIGGGILGAIPQCGFSVVAANLFSGRLISMGTLIAVFLSTSDEAIPMILSNPQSLPSLWRFILIKTFIAIIAGILIDTVIKRFKLRKEQEPFKEICTHCDCEHHGFVRAAISHTLNILIFILITNIVLGFAIEFAGEANLKAFMMTNSVFQPLLTALFGFIPNCASSIVITQLYIEGIVSFGSAIAGLSTGAGVGLLVLFKTNKNLKENFIIIGILYFVAVISGLLLNIIM